MEVVPWECAQQGEVGGGVGSGTHHSCVFCAKEHVGRKEAPAKESSCGGSMCVQMASTMFVSTVRSGQLEVDVQRVRCLN